MRKSKEKCLFKCESVLNAQEYKKIAKYFPDVYWSFVKRSVIPNIVLTAIVTIMTKSWIDALIVFLLSNLLSMVICAVCLESLTEREFYRLTKGKSYDSQFQFEFYDNYFILQGETTSSKFEYTEINSCLETDTDFYLSYNREKNIILLQKNKCDSKLIKFIREKFKNQSINKYKFKNQKNFKNPKFIKTGMIILFILTIACLWLGMYLVGLVNMLAPKQGFGYLKNMWAFWCLLPIPILSIVLGFKYRKEGFKCTKNIVGGFIIGLLLVAYGSFCLFPLFSVDYSKIYDYKDIIDATLPNNGTLEIQDWDTYFDQDKTDYRIINAYYNQEDVSELEKSIENNNNNWILSTEINSELKIFIPSQLLADDDAYYSIYNATTKEYNTLPESIKTYEIYAMKYDKSTKLLEIHQFKYFYQ